MRSCSMGASSRMPCQTVRQSAVSSTAATTISTDGDGSATSITDIHPDILRTHIFTRLDGPALASAACTSPQLYRLATQQNLWADICRSTWPSTHTPRLEALISAFPQGPRSFFSDSFPLRSYSEPSSTSPHSPRTHSRPSELISAVDIYYRGKMIFSKVVETETVSGWFRCSPFRIDMLDPKDVVPTPIKYPSSENTCRELEEDLTLSWIMIDATGRQAMNLSSYKPVCVQRHWLSGEVHARFATVLGGDRGSASECVQCGIVVTCGGWEGGDLQVREVNLQVEDMDDTYLTGRDTLVILERALGGRKGISVRKRLEEFIEKKRERKERKARREGTLDMMCLAFGLFGFASLCIFLFFR